MSLLDYSKELFRQMITTVKLSAKCDFMVLIIDDTTLESINSMLAMSEITDMGVALVESIGMEREPIPSLDAVYFVAPRQYTHILEDFQETPKYKSAHLFFPQAVPASVMGVMASHPIAPFIQNFSEICLDFYIKEPHVFSFRQYQLFPKLYNGTAEVSELAQISQKLTSVCVAMKEYPNVMYTTTSPYAEQIAQQVQGQIDEFYRQDPSLQPNAAVANVLILDRTFDPVAPLLHDFHYEAAVYDLYSVGKGGVVTYTAASMGSAPERKEAILNHKDDMWMRHKYAHIADLQAVLREERQKFVADKQHILGIQTDLSENPEQMAKVIFDLPEYNETAKKYNIHDHLIAAVFHEFEARGLQEIVELEQTIATGVSQHRKEIGVKQIDKTFHNLLLQPNRLAEKDRRRLILLYALCITLNQQDQAKFMASLSTRDANLVSNLQMFGVSFSGNIRTAKKQNKKEINENKRQARESLHSMARVPYKLEDILNAAVENRLNPQEYKAVR